MPPPRELYSRLTSFTNLHAAARRAQRGKRYRPAVLAFHANLEAELLRLQEELRAFTYQPGDLPALPHPRPQTSH
jgi:RNA-directed DNA polymerase